MIQAATIKLFLVTGAADSLRTAELSNWSGKAIAAPRSEIAQLRQRSEVQSTGIYFLTGIDPKTDDAVIYIGESENVSERLKQHSEKDYWTAVTVFVSKDENLTKAHIRYLEDKLIQLARESKISIVKNAASSGSKLPESDAAEMDVFLEKCLQLLPVLGVLSFQSAVVKPKTQQEGLLYCKIKGLVATGQRTSQGFVVFKGSQAALEHRPSARNLRTKREELLEKNILINESTYLRFVEDVIVGSPSTAAGLITGGNTNGLTAWKTETGISLKEIEESDCD